MVLNQLTIVSGKFSINCIYCIKVVKPKLLMLEEWAHVLVIYKDLHTVATSPVPLGRM